MVQTLARCRSCGLPAKLAESIEWRGGGGIVFSRMRSLRLAMLDERTMDGIHQAVAAQVGEDAITEAEREYTRIVAGRILAGIRGRLTRYGAIKKRALEGMEEYSMLLGMGRMEIEKFTPAVGGTLNLHRPFNLCVSVAGVTGTLEEMDRCRYDAEITATGEHSRRLDLHVMETQDVKAGPQRDIPLYVGRKGAGKREGCHLCGLPPFVSQLVWDELYGVVTAGIRGRRVAFVPAYILAALADTLADPGAGERPALLEEVVFDATRKSIEGGTDDAYESADVIPREGDARAAWESMSMRGWGEVVESELLGESWRVDVAGVVDGGLVAGWLRALHAAATGKETSARVETGKEYTTFRLD